MRIKKIIIFIFLLVSCCFATEILAQCPMCKMAAESNLENGGSMGKGLNTGILYMFVMPYLMVFTLGYIWYKNKRVYIDEEAQFPTD